VGRGVRVGLGIVLMYVHVPIKGRELADFM
jgi:hypothetical protein